MSCPRASPWEEIGTMTAQAAPADARQPGSALHQWLKRYPKGVDWHRP